MPRIAGGITPISRKIASSRVRTARWGTRGTARRSPSGKKNGRRRRQACSLAKKMNAVVTEPAITVRPKTWRAAWENVRWPIRNGIPTP